MTQSLHLSLLSLDPVTSRSARTCLVDIQEMHRLVMSGFPHLDAPASRAAMGVLFRIDSGDRLTQVLVQSTTEPDWSQLDKGTLAAPARTRDASPLLDLPIGARLRFRLVANPTRAIRPPGRTSRHAQRVPLRRDDGPAGRIAWLQRHAGRSGFRIDPESLLVTSLPLLRGRREHHAPTVIEPCRFEGLLEVTEADAFRAAILSGVGRARAYGCGLMSVARP